MSYFPPGGGGEPALEATEIIVEQIAEISTTNDRSNPRVIAKYRIDDLPTTETGNRRGILVRTEFISGDLKTTAGLDTGEGAIYVSDDDVVYQEAGTARVQSSATSYEGVSNGNFTTIQLRTPGSGTGYFVVGLAGQAGGDTYFLKNFLYRAFLFLPHGATITRLV